jgi:hypothetical protein
VGTLVAGNVKVATVGFGGNCIWRVSKSLESGGLFCVGAFDRNLASVAEKIF